jgi:hypothetical protein
MPTLPHPEDVRETVLRAFSELRRRAITRGDVIETILLRQGCYYGRAYRQGSLVATLTVETATLCICTDDGRVLQTIELAAEAPPAEAAIARAA